METHLHNLLPTGNEAQLEKLVKDYPWYSLSRLSLLQYHQKNNPAQFEKQAQIAALYFTDTKWLKWQLHLLAKEEDRNFSPEAEKNELPQNNFAPATEVKKEEETIAFEPLHTVDYFASQGIKISDEPVTNDKVGNQLKSFTEWLRSMKKLHKDHLPHDEGTDKKIQQIAENSNAEAGVATEAMAEVLVKQNKIDKAIEVYTKLSLMNPSKSDYFAAQIHQLKSS